MQRIILIPLLLSMFFLIACKNEKEKDPAENEYVGQKFKENIRPTEALSPEDERRGFKLPEGFEITLYASEPDIGKPINIAFDAKGRMWVTQSFEYPFAATPGNGKDRLTILEDTDNDGKADKFLHFNDTLNIPIGIMPVNDGAITYSIPNVYRYVDTNGDGKVDSQKKLLGPFEYKDTHGMVNNFLIGFDGWIHACHGYTNRSAVAGTDGDSIHMVSGNTFRFRRDGSRVENTTFGRINPFGLAYDELGYLYSTDCHTSPLYQLIRGGDYMQWGKEEQMGFAPDMKPLENEATALAGLAYYADTQFPAAYQKNFYIGDVVVSRIYRNSSTWKGSSPVGKREEDFLMSQDPWFRPVDVKLGPDGALYVADFYNSIIGHYEVALTHPKRDRIRGRIWRITYKGKGNKLTDWTVASTENLIGALNSDNLPVRLTAADQLVERIGQPAVAPVEAMLGKKGVSTREYVHGLWILERLNALSADVIAKASTHPDAVVRLHTMRILGEQGDPSIMMSTASKALHDADPHVQRAAVELMWRYPDMQTIETLAALRHKTPEYDSHMIYTLRLAVRNLLRNESLMRQVASRQWSPEDAAFLVTVLPGVQTSESGKFLYSYVKSQQLEKDKLPKAFLHIARFIPHDQMASVITTAREQSAGDADLQYLLFNQLQEGVGRRGSKEIIEMQAWGKALAIDLINNNKPPEKKGISEVDGLAMVRDRRRFAMELAGNYKLLSLEPFLLSALKDSSVNIDLRTSALRALLKINSNKNIIIARTIFKSKESTDDFRKRVLSVIGEFPGAIGNEMMAGLINIPPDMQQLVAMSLANSPEGINILLQKVKKGEILARLLIQPKTEERIMTNVTPKQKAEFNELTANLESINKEKEGLIAGRITDFNDVKSSLSPATGRTVFLRNCATCHSIAQEGGSIGPQLDGVGKWGVTSLAEKILDPNRNVSESFRNYTIRLKDGKVRSGLYRRDEGAIMVFADVSGKEFTIAKKDIAARTASKYTLMPDQFSTIISPGDFNSLIAYLLTVKN